MILVKILKINWGLDFLWSKIYDKGMVKERQGKCVMILYHNSLCVLACTGTQNRIKEQSMYYIGIDLGTSAVKLLLMEGNGKIVRVASREYPLYFPHPGWSQQNPEDWYKQSMDGLCELLDGIDKSRVAGISFGGQMHGLVVLDENDQVIPVFEDPAFVKGMTYIKELWDAGTIDPELMLNDMSKKEEKFYQGKAGMMPAPLFRHVTRHENSVRELFPDASICYDLSPAGPDGARGLSKQGKSGMMTCITAACKNPDKAAAFVDFMVSEEGNNLLRLGIEGIHYTKDGDEIVFNEEERAKDAFSPNGWAHALAWGSFYWPLESNYIPVTDPNRERALHTVDLATQCQVPNLIKQKTQVEIENGAAVDDIYTQYFSDMLQGKLSIEEGVEQLSKSWRSQGGEEILEAVNAEYQKTKAKQ